MTVQTLERPSMSLAPYPPVYPHADRLRLRDHLYLIAHDDDTGRLHIDQRALTVGLAGAVLLELWFAGRVQIGWRYDVRKGAWEPEPGVLTVLDPTPIGDTVADSALSALWHTGTTIRVLDFVRRYAAITSYERVRADMVAAGVLKQARRRRFLFFHTDIHKAVHRKSPVRARARVRDLVADRRYLPDRPDTDHLGIALAGLVATLGLTSYLLCDTMSVSQLHVRLRDIVALQPHPAVRDVVAAIDNCHGDLAVAALRAVARKRRR